MIRLESRVIRDDVKPRGLHLMPAIGVFAMFQLRSAAAFLLRMVIGNKKPCRNAKSSMLARFVTGDGRNANFRG